MSNAISIFVFLIILSTNAYPYCYHLSKPDLRQRYEGSNAKYVLFHLLSQQQTRISCDMYMIVAKETEMKCMLDVQNNDHY